MKIGNIEIDDQPVFLAPMESITDLPFRVICRELGADVVFSEFIASEAIIRDSEKSFKKMTVVDAERPVAIQIFGSNIDSMVQSAKIVEDAGADILDINFGCWVKKVVKNNAGAALLKYPDIMVKMTEALVKAVKIPVTVKTRLGWDKNSIVIVETAKKLEQAGAAALTVHCRTREQGLKGEADWSWIPKIKEVFNPPLILNGDVKTPKDAKKAFDTTGCDGVMIGRACVGDPFIFDQMKHYLKTGEEKPLPSFEDKIDLCLRHLKTQIEYKGFPTGLYEFRKHYSGYVKGLYNASNIRQKIIVMESYEEIEQELRKYLESFEVYRNSKV